MYKKVPAINRNDQLVSISIPPIIRPTITPRKQRTLETILKNIAFFIDTPVLLFFFKFLNIILMAKVLGLVFVTLKLQSHQFHVVIHDKKQQLLYQNQLLY